MKCVAFIVANITCSVVPSLNEANLQFVSNHSATENSLDHILGFRLKFLLCWYPNSISSMCSRRFVVFILRDGNVGWFFVFCYLVLSGTRFSFCGVSECDIVCEQYIKCLVQSFSNTPITAIISGFSVIIVHIFIYTVRAEMITVWVVFLEQCEVVLR